MTSAAQIAANIVNAQPSTGPTTFEGKTRSAENARKFGFYSKQAVLLKIGASVIAVRERRRLRAPPFLRRSAGR